MDRRGRVAGSYRLWRVRRDAGGALGGGAVLLAPGDAVEEVVDLRADLEGERRVASAAEDLGARGAVILVVVVVGARATKRGCRRHGRGDFLLVCSPTCASAPCG
jgi:hypothetical protein